MKILRSYALGELILPFIISISVLTFIFLLGYMVKLADLIVAKGVSLIDVMQVMILIMPQIISYTLPTGVLTAVLLVFGSMAQQNEITAMKASGVNVVGVMVPAMVLAFIISIVSLFINDQVTPEAQFRVRKAVKEILVKQPTAYLEEGKFIKAFKGYVIFTKEIRGNELRGVTIYQPQGDGKAIRTIIAERGEISSDPIEKRLSLKLYNGTSDESNPKNPEEIYKLDFESFELPTFDMGGSTSNMEKKIKDLTIDELVMKLREQNPDLGHTTELMTRFKAEIHKKIAFSFAPLVFALIGLPMAIITKRGEVIISFLLALCVVAVYYVLFVWANTIAVQGVVPPAVALWTPNVLMGLISFLLFKKAVRL